MEAVELRKCALELLKKSEKAESAEEAENFAEEAAEKFSRALEKICSEHGELAAEAAPYYYDYGDALLVNSTRGSDVFGSELQRHADLQDATNGTLTELAQGPDNDDLDIAFEVLDTARVIYESIIHGNVAKSRSEKPSEPIEKRAAQIALARVHSRLGDLQMETDKFAEAEAEFVNCIEIQKLVFPEHEQAMASTYMNLAVCALYLKNTSMSLQNYKGARSVLSAKLVYLKESIEPSDKMSVENSKGEAPVVVFPNEKDIDELEKKYSDKTKEISEMRELVEYLLEIDERIEGLEKELRDGPVQAAAEVTRGQNAFALPKAQYPSPLTSSSSSGNSTEKPAQDGTCNMLQPKRKVISPPLIENQSPNPDKSLDSKGNPAILTDKSTGKTLVSDGTSPVKKQKLNNESPKMTEDE